MVTNTSQSPTATNTPRSTPTFTSTAQQQVGILANQAPDQIATALNLEIDEMQVTLTAAADQISTLNAHQAALAKTATSGVLPTSTPISGFIIPSNVYVVTLIDYTLLAIPESYNAANAPIMVHYEPRIKLEPGFQTWVYEEKIQADGGEKYYRLYDPDGESSADFHIKALDIQIRAEYGDPPPGEYPTDVAKARLISNTIAYTIIGNDDGGKPVMEMIKPRITYQLGSRILLHAKPVVATGNEEFLVIYDPDGNSSAYIKASKIEFLEIWD